MTKIIQVGNSKGWRLSKTILDQFGIEDSIQLIMKNDHIELRPVKKTREGWGELFKEMHENGDDQLLMEDVFEDESFES